MAVAELEKILQKLLLPDNNAIQQASLELKAAFTRPDIVVPALVELLQISNEPTIRQYCAILLRRRVVKQWKNLPIALKERMKTVLLETVPKETVEFVRASICQVIGALARHELLSYSWPELLQFISTCVQSPNVNEREVGFCLLKILTEAAAEQLKPWYNDLFKIFQVGLNDGQSKVNAYYTIRSITQLIQFFGTDEEVLLKPMLGNIMDIVKALLKIDEEKANEALDIFDELIQVEIGIIKPYVKSLVEFCMQIISCQDFDDGIRIKALYLVCWACRRKCQLLLKSKLLKPLVILLISLLSIPRDDSSEDDDDDDENNDELNSLQSVAGQALDLLALHSPPGKLIPILMETIGPLFTNENEYSRKSAYIALGQIAEGCADHIRTRYLQHAIDAIMKGMGDEKSVVRNGALYAMGQYAEFVQPEVGKFHSTVLPTLLQFLQMVTCSEGNQQHKGTLTKLFYALEKFTEGLEKDIIKEYTQDLVQAFIVLLKNSSDGHTIELAISGIGALVTSAQEHLTTYFPMIMDTLKIYLTQPITIESMDVLAQTIDTLAALARYLSVDIIQPVVSDCMDFGIKILNESDDPDLRRCTYGLFASMSIVIKHEMMNYMEVIAPMMIASLKSTEGIIASEDPNAKDPLILIEDEVNDEDLNSDDDDDENVGYSVENAYMEEKEDTINALAEIIENIGDRIMASMKDIFHEVLLLTDYPHSNVRKAAVCGCCRLTAVMCKFVDGKNPNDITEYFTLTRTSLISSLRLSTNILKQDDDRDVVTAVVEGLEELLKQLNHPQLIIVEELKLLNVIVDVIKGKVACQQVIDDDVISQDSFEESESSQAELDLMLIEKAGDILPLYAKIIGGEHFRELFRILLPEFIKKSKKNCTVPEKSFAVGTVAEITQAMGSHISEFVPTITRWLLQVIQYTDDEVRSNSAFALGVLVENSGDNAISEYMVILECFHLLLQTQQAPLVQDNICGALSRMIMTSPQNIPLEQVLPALVNCLPIQEDERENETVTKCFVNLYASKPDMIFAFGDKLFPYFIESLKNEQSGLEQDTREKVKMVLSDVQNKFPDKFQAIVTLK